MAGEETIDDASPRGPPLREVNPGRLHVIGIAGPGEGRRQRLTRHASERSFLIPAWRFKARQRLVVELRDGKEFPLVPEMEPAAAVQPGVRDLRRRAQLTQTEFASRLGVPVETIRNWEQGKRAPRGPARALLAVIAHSPETVFAALSTEAEPA